MDDLRDLFQQAVWSTAQVEGVPAVLGLADGTLYVPADAWGTAYGDLVWATLFDGQKVQVVCRVLTPAAGVPVRIAERDGLLTVIRTDGNKARVFTNYRSIEGGAHAWAHRRLGPDSVWLDGQQVLQLMAYPTTPPGMTVRVAAGWYWTQGNFKGWADAVTSDLSAYVPSAVNSQHFVVIALNRATASLDIVDGTTVAGDAFNANSPASVPFTAADIEALPFTEAQRPICAVRFYTDQTAIRVSDIFLDLRPWGGDRPSDPDALLGRILTDRATGQVLVHRATGDVLITRS